MAKGAIGIVAWGS